MKYIIVNGEILKKEEANLTFLFREELFILSQKIWYGYGGIPLFFENIENLCNQLEMIGAPVPLLFENQRELFRITKRMLNKNRFFRSGVIMVQLFLAGKTVNFAITATGSETFDFPISENGIFVNFSEYTKSSDGVFGKYAFQNRGLWLKELSEIDENEQQNSLFLNKNNFLCEAISSNVFMVKEKTLFTPALNTGCFEDNIRKHILEMAKQLHYKIQEKDDFRKTDIFMMNEVFLASEEKGIEWVVGVENKRYIRRASAAIHLQLNDFLKEKAG